MLTEWLFWILLILFFAFTFYLLHIPLPIDISDRSKLAVAEILLRLSNEYLGDLTEYLFGPAIRNKGTRFIMNVGFIIPQKPPKGITRTLCSIGGVPCITYDTIDKKKDGLLIFIHGGGWCVGEAKHYDGILYELVQRSGVAAVSIDYRLAPEHPFPAGPDDCEAVVKTLYYNGCETLRFDKNKIVIAGDSAGGNLAAVVCQRLATTNENFIKAQILIYPVTHCFNFNSPSYQEYWTKYNGTALLNPKNMARWILLYLGVDASRKNLKKLMNSQHVDLNLENSTKYQEFLHYENLPENFRKDYAPKLRKPVDPELALMFAKIGTNPEISPFFGITSNLPPAFVLTAGYDILRDEGIQYTQKLKRFGVPTEWKHYPRAFHGLFNMPNSAYRLEMMQAVADFTSKFV